MSKSNRETALELFNEGERDGGVCTQCQSLCWESIEPDAEQYPCDECGARKVMGMENYFMAFLPL
jgi:hypothetical protein